MGGESSALYKAEIKKVVDGKTQAELELKRVQVMLNMANASIKQHEENTRALQEVHTAMQRKMDQVRMECSRTSCSG